MKKTLTALAVTATFAAPVFAQSSVTLYGVIDEGLNYTNNVGTGHVYEMASGYAQSSRWGLKGSEDLGGGMKAIFQLENGFDVNSGRLNQGGRMFGRQAYVGLSQTQYGTLTFGRQYDSVVDYLAPTTANGNWGGYLLAHPFDNDNTDNSFRLDNTVKYASPNFGGFQFGGAYSFSNSTSFSDNRAYSVGAQYQNNGLLIGAAYLQANHPGNGSAGAITANDASYIAERMRVFGAGINYTFGQATVGFAYTNSSYKNPTGNGYLGTPGAIIAPGRDGQRDQVPELRGERFVPGHAGVHGGRAVRAVARDVRRIDRQREAEDPFGRADGRLQPVEAHRRVRAGRVPAHRRRQDELDPRQRVHPRYRRAVVDVEPGGRARRAAPQVLM
ncbi:membrane protein [Burkholderia contaminans]|nr:membrane protein [Burkholderia contaminans]